MNRKSSCGKPIESFASTPAELCMKAPSCSFTMILPMNARGDFWGRSTGSRRMNNAFGCADGSDGRHRPCCVRPEQLLLEPTADETSAEVVASEFMGTHAETTVRDRSTGAIRRVPPSSGCGAVIRAASPVAHHACRFSGATGMMLFQRTDLRRTRLARRPSLPSPTHCSLPSVSGVRGRGCPQGG